MHHIQNWTHLSSSPSPCCISPLLTSSLSQLEVLLIINLGVTPHFPSSYPHIYRCGSLSPANCLVFFGGGVGFGPANCNSQISTMLSCSLHSYSPTSFQSLSLVVFTLKRFQSFLPQSRSNHPSNSCVWSHYFSAQNSSELPHCFQYKIWTPAAGSQFTHITLRCTMT